MIERSEIESKSAEFQIHTSNVQRDYIFGWILGGIYANSSLGTKLAMKGGNCLRKAYFETARFSRDLDFAAETEVGIEHLTSELKGICDWVSKSTGVQFEIDATRVEARDIIDQSRNVLEARLYFKDFYGNPDKFTLSVRLDVSEFERIMLPLQTRKLIHPYSDASDLHCEVKCVKIEEQLATKLKLLLQRRECQDLYDFLYAFLINNILEIDRSELVATFLKKTIFESSPGHVRGLLLDLPLNLLKAAWTKYVVCPVPGRMEFDRAVGGFEEVIEALFGHFRVGQVNPPFFPTNLRVPIIDAGKNRKLIRMRYDGVERLIEPYALSYKRRSDGVAREYFYGYDTSGGRSSGPSIKSFLHHKVQSLEITDTSFEPRFVVELSKAGEYSNKTYFSGSFRGGSRQFGRSSPYTVICNTCGKKFPRKKPSTRIRRHKDRDGFPCSGKSGSLI